MSTATAGHLTEVEPATAHVDELCAHIEAALEHAPEPEGAKASSALQELWSLSKMWIRRAHTAATEACMSLAPGGAIAAHEPPRPGLETATQIDKASAKDTITSAGPSMCKMLIVEDSSFQAMTMLALAEDSGYQAHVVDSADEAIEVLRHDEDVNLVLSDVMMDGVDGLQLLVRIRAEFKAHIAVVMVSAHESPGLVEQCVNQGADAYLLKPMRVLELRNLWQYVWRRRHEAVLLRSVPPELLKRPGIGGGSDRAVEPAGNILRPDEAQRATAAHLEDFAAKSEAAVSSLQAHGLEQTLADVDRLMGNVARDRRLSGDSADSATAEAQGAAAAAGLEVCKICGLQFPRTRIIQHVVSCSALTSCSERVREIDAALKRAAGMIGSRHAQLEASVQDLRSQIDTLAPLKQMLLDVAAIPVLGDKVSPLASAKHIEQLLETMDTRLGDEGAKWHSRSAHLVTLWEKVRRIPRTKVAICWDVVAVDDPRGGDTAPESSRPAGGTQKVTLRDFDIVDVLGSGGYGTVYLARRRSTTDLVAIKALTKAHLRETNALANVQLERLILSSVNSPFVVELYFSFSSTSNVYMVMEYMPRGDCHDLLRQLGFFEEDLASFYLAETVEGLAYLHSQGVIMRDLKPQNMLIGADGHLKLTDFGLSAAYYGASREGIPATIPGTAAVTTPVDTMGVGGVSAADSKSGMPVAIDGGAKMVSGWFGGAQCVGTPNYLAPEVLLHKRVTYALDLWSLGVVMYEFLVGEPPFDDETPEDIFENIVGRRLNQSIVNSLSKPASNLVRQLLNSEDKERIGLTAVKKHPFFSHVNWGRLRELEPSIKPAKRHPEEVQPRWSGAVLDPTGSGDEEEDEAFTSFESKNVRKLALMHLDQK